MEQLRILSCILLLACVCALLTMNPAPEPPSAPDLPTPAPNTASRSTAKTPPTPGDGRVVDSSEHPIPHATVCACPQDACTEPTACTESDAQGRFTLRVPVAGAYHVYAAASGYLPTLAEGSPLHLAVGAALRIELTRGAGQVTGVVMDALGGPVADADVRARVAFEGAAGTLHVPVSARSDAAGQFELWLPKRPAAIEALADGYAPARVTRTPGVSGLKLVLIPAARLRGRTFDAVSGRPVSGVRVVARSQELWHDAPAADSDQSGRFVLNALRSGVYRLEASAPGFRASSPLLELAVAEVMDDIELPLARAVEIDALVLGPDDAPGCGAGSSVLLSALPEGSRAKLEPARIDASGRVHWDAVPSGRYQAAVRCTEASSPPLQVLEVGDESLSDLVFRAGAGHRLTIWLSDAQGAPSAGVPIDLRQQSVGAGAAPPVARRATSDAAGRVVFTGLPAGSFLMQSALLSAPTSVDLAEPAAESELWLRVLAGGRIEVAVRAQANESLDGVRVYALGSSGRPWGAESPLSDGRALIGPLPAGEYRVFARDGVHQRVSGESSDGRQLITLADGRTVQVEVTLPERRGRVRGRVSDQDGQPLGSVRVSASASDAEIDPIVARIASYEAQVEGRYALSADDGSFELHGLNSRESFTIEAQRPFHGRAQQRGVRTGEWLELELEPLRAESLRR